jgi:hypothetical protein
MLLGTETRGGTVMGTRRAILDGEDPLAADMSATVTRARSMLRSVPIKLLLVRFKPLRDSFDTAPATEPPARSISVDATQLATAMAQRNTTVVRA